ncbi:response regulator [Azospirillum sp. 11R-A]|uniref:response regulator n=1 Tax=Azospirillum sp. 11R-A TaxID=3111634 RepID=UPI003C14FE69
MLWDSVTIIPLPGKKDTLILMLTAHSEQTVVTTSLKVGARGYLVKPIVPKKLIQMIAKVCHSKLPTLIRRAA